MLTHLALAAIRFYQRNLRHAGVLGVAFALLVVVIVGAAEVFGIPLLILLATQTAAPLGPILMIVTALGALLGAAVLGVAGLAVGAPFSSCRYTPSCSNYAIIAYSRFGIFWGSLLSGWRLLRCAPWGSHGWDPVPDRKDGRPDRAGTPRQIPPDKHHRHGQVLPTRREA